MTKLNMKHFVLTITSFTLLVSILCAAFVFAAPKTAVTFFNMWMHGVDLTPIMKTPSLPDAIIGTLTLTVVTALLSAVFVKLWNYFYDKTAVER